MSSANLPKIGSEFSGGIYAGVTTSFSGRPYALVLLPDKAGSCVNWKTAGEWARSIGGDLPTRLDAALLFANLDKHLASSWVFISDGDEHPGNTDWGRVFNDGWYSKYRNRSGFGAYAVRRIPLEVSISEAA